MTNHDAITLEDSRDHGLSGQEHDRMIACMGRIPNRVELGIFSVMWSEHCSYKSSRHWLAQLPTQQPWVVCGPGENAGVIDIGNDDVAIFKIESHNHPSFIEPYQGAATGVGGILRDVFTMGARPLALMNALRFGARDHPRTPYLLHGVSAGIGGYGNCFGIPTIGGETEFHAAYNGNILVNAFALGIAKRDQLFFSAASGVGNPVLYVGAATGADGVHGATLASASFDDNALELRPTVQVGDPFGGKCLMEACLELMRTGAVLAIQDMGAAGLTSSSVEMASKGNVGIDLNLDLVPLRDQNIGPYEIMLSESQERMLIILHPGKEEIAKKVFAKWDIAANVIGTLTNSGHLRISMHGKPAAD
ncbi:MAG: AIR synthase-related protein, partial [Pseudomonadota bacterium]